MTKPKIKPVSRKDVQTLFEAIVELDNPYKKRLGTTIQLMLYVKDDPDNKPKSDMAFLYYYLTKYKAYLEKKMEIWQREMIKK